MRSKVKVTDNLCTICCCGILFLSYFQPHRQTSRCDGSLWSTAHQINVWRCALLRYLAAYWVVGKGFDFGRFLCPTEDLITQSSLFGMVLPHMCRRNLVRAVMTFIPAWIWHKGCRHRSVFWSRFTAATFPFPNETESQRRRHLSPSVCTVWLIKIGRFFSRMVECSCHGSSWSPRW